MRARSASGRPRAATDPSTIIPANAVRAGHTASLQGISTRRAAIEAVSGSTIANPIADPTQSSAAAKRVPIGFQRITLPSDAPLERSSASRIARAASALPRAAPDNSNSTADASLPCNSGRMRSMRNAISTGCGLNRNAGNTTFRMSTNMKPAITASMIPRKTPGNRTTASTAATPITLAKNNTTNAATAPVMRSARARPASRTTVRTISERTGSDRTSSDRTSSDRTAFLMPSAPAPPLSLNSFFMLHHRGHLDKPQQPPSDPLKTKK